MENTHALLSAVMLYRACPLQALELQRLFDAWILYLYAEGKAMLFGHGKMLGGNHTLAP